jgi:enamine deaminase RidA (YjgF/YER057c/UK114 family)
MHRFRAVLDWARSKRSASLSDIIETRTYAADLDQLAKYADLRKQYFGSASPARTIVQKERLSDPANLVEVMAFAAIK